MTKAESKVPAEYRKGHARLNPTVAALISRGVDSHLARTLKGQGLTLKALQLKEVAELTNLGIPQRAANAIQKSARPPIPYPTLAAVLIANRFTCCVCHDTSRAIVVHHIIQWSVSRDHGAHNLAVVCQEHHDKAHQKGGLTQNLTPALVTSAKGDWEAQTSKFDARSILDADGADSDNWWYFNHQRLFTLASDLRVNLKAIPHFAEARGWRLVDSTGTILPRDKSENWMYAGGDGIPLARYVSDVLRAVISELSAFNASNDLDRGILESVIKSGDFIFIQGAMNFKSAAAKQCGPGQTAIGIRKVNSVEISFSVDRWEATSQSAWSGLLLGHHDACALLRVLGVKKVDKMVQIEATSLAIGPPLLGMKTREYANAPFRAGYWPIDDESAEEPDWDGDWESGPDNPANYESKTETDDGK